MQKRIAITGMGMITRAGGTEETLDAVFSGKSQIARLPEQFNLCPTQIGGYIEDLQLSRWFDPKQTKKIDGNRTSRPTKFSSIAIKQALENSKLLDNEGLLLPQFRQRTGISIGTGIGDAASIERLAVQMYKIETAQNEEERQTLWKELVKNNLPTAMTCLPVATAFQPSITHAIQGPISASFAIEGSRDCIDKACSGGAGNIRRGAMEIELDHADIMITGGTEAFTPVILTAFNVYAQKGALSRRNDEPEKASRPFDEARDGFVPAEGAGVVVLEEYKHAVNRGAPILSELIGYGETTDGKGRTDPDLESQIRAMQMALDHARIKDHYIGIIKAHGTSTIHGDLTELLAIKELFYPHGGLSIAGPHIFAPKSIIGHTLGAAGAIEACILIEAMRRHEVPMNLNLENPIKEILLCENSSEYHVHNRPYCKTVNLIVNKVIRVSSNFGMANSFGFGGQNCVLVFKNTDSD